jgi:hypothetical protein
VEARSAVRTASPSVRLVSASDKLHNARAILRDYRRIGDELWSGFTGEKEGTLWYYRALVEAFEASGRTELVPYQSTYILAVRSSLV